MVMIKTAFVRIWDELAGAVAWDESAEIASFQYDSRFLEKKWELSPLKMPVSSGDIIYSFPELKRTSTFKGLPGLLADTLPDNYGSQLINAWLARNGRPEDSMNPVELLCFIGTRGIGALEFEPAQFKLQKRAFTIELESLVTMAQNILSKKKDFSANLRDDEQQSLLDILKIGTSAGGARPKAIIAYNQKTGQVKSGQTKAPAGFEHWIIKLDGVGDAQFGESTGYGRVEMAYYLMAKDCGIDIKESILLEEKGRAHFMTKRFDRDESWRKHHIQTLCAMQHFDFNNINSYSYEQLFQTMRLLRLSYPQAEQMFRRMVFNVLAQNCDDHSKNFSFRLKKDENWELAPAYDLCHAYRPGSEWVSQHALSINGKRQNITKHDLLTLAKSMSIKKAEQIVVQLNEIVQKWPHYAELTKVDPRLRDAIHKTLINLA
jgi:serine/threonine-protein kinase HipA